MVLRISYRLAATTLAAVSCIGLAACTTTAIDSSGGETAAKAATFRYLFASNASALKGNATTYCINSGSALTPRNPNPKLLAALSDVRPAVQPISACRAGDKVVDGADRTALIFNLETTECDELASCFFRGGYQEGNISASSAVYHARFANGRWEVTQEGPIAIS